MPNIAKESSQVGWKLTLLEANICFYDIHKCNKKDYIFILPNILSSKNVPLGFHFFRRNKRLEQIASWYIFLIFSGPFDPHIENIS